MPRLQCETASDLPQSIALHPLAVSPRSIPTIAMPLPSLDTPRLTASGFPARVEHHAELPSTQDLARQRAAEPDQALPLLIVADQQTAGRGRGGNSWWTGPGSLAFSLLLDPAALGPPRRGTGPVSLAAGVAIVDVAAPRIAPIRVGLHWPNDVFAEGRKLAGVLVEVLADGRLIIGVGLNSNNRAADAPPNLQTKVATLRDLTGREHDHSDLLVELMERLAARLRQIASDYAALAAAFDGLCLQRGQMLTLRLGDRSVSGRCAGIASDGGLLLETPAGRKAFYSGALEKSAANSNTAR